MSRRTSEASKAIRKAWENERKLVLKGEGTRDWTLEQQHSIIDNGKAYDDEGKAFEGHHMKSAEEYPEYQGDSNNIQFLTRTEHQNAHGGSFQNSTNGYYDPITGITKYFGEDILEPCQVIHLSKPIASLVTGELEFSEDKETKDGVESSDQKKTVKSRVKSSKKRRLTNAINKKTALADSLNKLKQTIASTSSSLKDWSANNSETIRKGIKVAVGVSAVVGLSVVAGTQEETDNQIIENEEGESRSTFDEEYDGNVLSSEDLDDDESEEIADDNNKGTPKRPHPRKGYWGRRWKKNEDGELELKPSKISETFIHKDQIDED